MTFWETFAAVLLALLAFEILRAIAAIAELVVRVLIRGDIDPKSGAGAALCLVLLAPPPAGAQALDVETCRERIACGARRVVVVAPAAGGPSCGCDGGFASATAPPDMGRVERSLWGAGLLAAAGADLWTTSRAERAGLAEQNAIMAPLDGRGRWAVKSAATVVGLAVARHLETRGHRRGSRVILATVVAAWAGAAVVNYRRTSQRESAGR